MNVVNELKIKQLISIGFFNEDSKEEIIDYLVTQALESLEDEFIEIANLFNEASENEEDDSLTPEQEIQLEKIEAVKIAKLWERK